ncbi:MAG: ribonuclease P protein component [Planctomycetes bacterium]|jgi:ribonuclease P protein component|nr:ribonuclease P protein component [Planctomycetota bacterium]
MTMQAPKRLTFRHRDRLHGRKVFAAVRAARCRKNAGPLSVLAMPNGLDHLRLGLTVSRRVGNAVTRNRIKRRLREAFRLGRADWPTGLDLVVIVHPHEALAMSEYQRLLGQAVKACAAHWERKARREAP